MNFIDANEANFVLLMLVMLIYKGAAAPTTVSSRDKIYDGYDYTTDFEPSAEYKTEESSDISTTDLVTAKQPVTSEEWVMPVKPTSSRVRDGGKQISFEDSSSETSTTWKESLKPYLTANNNKDVPIFERDGSDSEKQNSVWSFLDEAQPDDGTQENDSRQTTQSYWPPTITGAVIVPITAWSRIQMFFSDNWLWVFLVILVVLLAFCLPGMIIQVYCNKYYLFYRKEKQHEKIPTPVEKNVAYITEESDEENGHEKETDQVQESQPEEHGSVKTEGNEENETNVCTTPLTALTQPIAENSNPVESPCISASANVSVEPVAPIHRVDVYSGPQVPIYETPPALMPQEDSLNTTSLLTPSASLPNAFQTKPSFDYPPIQVYPLQKVKQVSSFANHPERNQRATAIGNEQIVESNSAYHHLQARPPQREPKEKSKSNPPKRPPKPKQYRIRPSTPPIEVKKPSHCSDSSDDKPHKLRQRKQRKYREKRKSKRQDVGKPKENQRTRNRDHNSNRKVTKEQRKPPSSSRKPDFDNAQLKQIRQRKELLQQIIQGLNEAEMLQCKLDRTRKWTRDQKLQSRKETQTRDGRNKRPRDRQKPAQSSHNEKKEHPPRYEDVVSESGGTKQTKKETETKNSAT